MYNGELKNLDLSRLSDPAQTWVVTGTDHLKLARNKAGVVPSLDNLLTVFTRLECFVHTFAFNELTEQVMILRQLPQQRGNPSLFQPRPLRDDDISRVIVWLNRNLKIYRISKGDVADAITLAARENTISPVKHYLEQLERPTAEDANGFLAKVAFSHFGVRTDGSSSQSSDFAALALKKFLVSAVARALRPGCKVDHIPILESKQGAQKSTGIKALFGEAFFGDNLPPPHSKDASDYVRGLWGIELAELSNVTKAEVEHVKAFVTRTEERFRPAYGRNAIIYPRRCVFIGTTNRTDYLRDETGNRRFWPIKIHKLDVDQITADRDKIWAAALALYEDGEKWWLTAEETKLAEQEQALRTTVDVWHETIAQWLDEHKYNETCIKEVAVNCLSLDTAGLTPPIINRIRGGLFYAGFESSSKRLTSGPHKGTTAFVRCADATEAIVEGDALDEFPW